MDMAYASHITVSKTRGSPVENRLYDWIGRQSKGNTFEKQMEKNRKKFEEIKEMGRKGFEKVRKRFWKGWKRWKKGET